MQEIQWHFYPLVAEHPIARAFVESLVKRRKRPKTVDAYARNLEDLMRAFLQFEIADVVEASSEQLETYVESLFYREPLRPRSKSTTQPGEKLSVNTILQRIVTARLFYDFCLFRGYRHNQTNPLPRGSLGYGDTPPKRGMIAQRARLPWIPSDSEWEKLITYLLQQESLRNQLMVLIAYDGALRREELVSLRVDDFDWATGHVTIRPETSKSGWQRTVIISRTTAELLKCYLWNERANILEVFGGEKQGPLFLSESNRNAGSPITLGTFNDVVERVRAEVDLPWLAPHTFRHLRCTVLKRCGVDLQDIALYAGHKHLSTTQIYIHLVPAEVSKRIRDATTSFDARMQHLIAQAMREE